MTRPHLASHTAGRTLAPTLPTCPQCQARPSRTPVRYRGRTPLCAQCYADNRLFHAERTKLRRREGPCAAPGRGASHSDDLPAAEIERRFTLALRQIRARAAQE